MNKLSGFVLDGIRSQEERGMQSRIVVSVTDEEMIFREIKAKLSANGFYCLHASGSIDALALAAALPVDALLVTSQAYARQLSLQVDFGRNSAPFIILRTPSEGEAVSCEVRLAAKETTIDRLLQVLEQELRSPARHLVGPRDYRLTSVAAPFAALVERAGALQRIEGMSIAVGSGGLIGKTRGELIPGENLLLECPSIGGLALRRSQVRYRDHDSYGIALFEPNLLDKGMVPSTTEEVA